MTPSPPVDANRCRADIQGLRALAIFPVVLFHAHEAWAPGGFVGVDVFFVISGYLITRILLRELETGRFSIFGFYERRVRRLFPALYVMLAAVVLGGWFLLPPDAFANLGKATAATAAFLSNLYFGQTSGYFEPSAHLMPLLHTWSLAVEEQFYLAFPLFLATAYRLARRHLTLVLCGCLAVSLAIAVWQAEVRPLDGFYLPIGRAYELLIGAIVAAAPLPRIRSRRMADALSLVAILMIIVSIATFRADMHFPGAAALIPCIGSALILHLGADQESVPIGGRLLSLKPLVFIGAISYSLYLWHWPALVYARYVALGDPGPLLIAGALAFATLAAWLSWRFVEQPFLGVSNRRRAFGAGGVAMILAAAVAALLVVSNGVPQRFDAAARVRFDAVQDYDPRLFDCHEHGRRRSYADYCVFGAAGAEPDSAVFADSLGAEMATVLGEQAAARGGAVMQVTSSSCPPALGFSWKESRACAARNRETLAALLGDDRVRTVYLAAAYADYPVEAQPALLSGYAAVAGRLHAAGKRVVLIYPVPKMPFPAPAALGLAAQRGIPPERFGIAVADFRRANRPFIEMLDRLSPETGAARIVPEQRLCDANWCAASRGPTDTLYLDEVHLTLAGARHVFGVAPPAAPSPIR